MRPFNGVNVPKWMAGRERLVTPHRVINAGNIVDVLSDVLPVYESNQAQIEYLYWYRRGVQPVLKREKKYRKEICNRIVENHADEIVNFHVGYRFHENVQYVRSSDENGERIGNGLEKLTRMLRIEGYNEQTLELADWIFLCGVGYRICLPKEYKDPDSCVDIGVLDPRFTAVVYSQDFRKTPVMSIMEEVYLDDNGAECTKYCCYTNNEYFEIANGVILSRKPHALGRIPVIEYIANQTRTGAFELAIPLLDAINTNTSNRVDGVEQCIQYFLKFINTNIDVEGFERLKEEGAILLQSIAPGVNTDVGVVSAELNQEQTQVLQDHLYNMVLITCSMPQRRGMGKSTSDTGSATEMGDGWITTEAAAKKFEPLFEGAERNFLRVVIDMCKGRFDLGISVGDIIVKCPRSRYDNLLVKTQALKNLLDSDVHPLRAYDAVGIFADSEQTYKDSEEYIKEGRKKKKSEAVKNLADTLVKLVGAEVAPEYAYEASQLFENPKQVADESEKYANKKSEELESSMARINGVNEEEEPDV